MNRITGPRSALVAAALALLTACGLQQGLSDTSGGQQSSPSAAPAINAATITGAHYSWAAAGGHPVVIDFWAAWCGPCRAEQADINRLYDKYAARGVVFLGVDVRDDNAAANAFARDYTVRYPSVSDADEQIAAAYDVAAPPTLILVDKQGRIVQRFLGTVVGVSDALDSMLTRSS